ncbi:MAG: BrnT family toxin [Gammaproteobacteria bacterium]
MSFADAEGVFYDPFAIHQLDSDSEDEERFVAVGMSSAGIILVAVYIYASWRGNPA